MTRTVFSLKIVTDRSQHTDNFICSLCTRRYMGTAAGLQLATLVLLEILAM
jgi:hypothetical protein